MNTGFKNKFPQQEIWRGDLRLQKTVLSAKPIQTRFDDQTCKGREIHIEAHQNNVREHIHELLPPNWRIIEAQVIVNRSEGECNVDERSVTVPAYHWRKNGLTMPFFCSRESMFTLLHEIGHAIHENDAAFNKKRNGIFQAISLFGTDEYLESEGAERYQQFIIGPEKTASRFAIRVIESLRQNGLDLEPGITRQNLIQIAEAALREMCLNETWDASLGDVLD